MEGLDSYYEGGPKTWEEAFPPVCVRSHWDPTQVTRHILPDHLSVPLQFDARQGVRICTSYYEKPVDPNTVPNSKVMEKIIPDSTVVSIPDALLEPEYYKRPYEKNQFMAVPPGGAAGLGAPYSEYAASINSESDLYRLDESLTKCKERRYIPKEGVADAVNTLPNVNQAFGLSPFATYVQSSTGCREEDDSKAWNRSGRLFFNHTRLDRVYPQPHGPLGCGKNV